MKNRGYDSAGIVSFAQNQHKPVKMLGKFAEDSNSSPRLNCI